MSEITIIPDGAEELEEQFGALIEADNQRLPSVIEMATSIGQMLVDNTDRNFIYLGELANIITGKLLDRPRINLKEFSAQIGVRAGSLSQYRNVVKFYGGRGACFEIFDRAPNIKFTHLREAMRMKNTDDAVEMLLKWAKENYSVDRAIADTKEALGGDSRPASLYRGSGRIINIRDNVLTVELNPADDEIMRLHDFVKEHGNSFTFVDMLILPAELE